MLVAHAGATKLGRHDLLALPTPEGTDTHRPVPHANLVQGIFEALAFRNIEVAVEEYAATPDGMRLFGVLALAMPFGDVRPVIAFRNSHDKSFALGLVAGFNVFCCDNLALSGEFVAVSKRHSKNLDVVETLALGIDRVQRKFQPMVQQIDVWKNHALPDIRAKEIIYDAFLGAVDAPKHLLKEVHRHYFEPEHKAFTPRNLWSLQNSFTSAFKQLEPIPMIRATPRHVFRSHPLDASRHAELGGAMRYCRICRQDTPHKMDRCIICLTRSPDEDSVLHPPAAKENRQGTVPASRSGFPEP